MKISQKLITVLLAISLFIALFYIFAVPNINAYFLNNAVQVVINNMILQLQGQGYIDLRVNNNQTLRLIPQVVQ